MRKFSSAYAFCHFLHEVFPTKQSKLISVEQKLKKKSQFSFSTENKIPVKTKCLENVAREPEKTVYYLHSFITIQTGPRAYISSLFIFFRLFFY